MVEHDGHIFLAPDNGLLAPVLEVASKIYKLDEASLKKLDLDEPSLTFHGRDIFAPVAAEFAAGRLQLADIGVETADWTPGWLEDPDVIPGRVSGVVVTIDAFGNLISNIDGSLIKNFKEPIVHLAGHDFDIAPTYGRVQPGQYLALINSFGVIEIARAEGSAAESLGTERGAPVVVTDSSM